MGNQITFIEWREATRSKLAEAIWERRKNMLKCRRNVCEHTDAIHGIKMIIIAQAFATIALLMGPMSFISVAFLLCTICIVVFRLIPYHRQRIRINAERDIEFKVRSIGMLRIAKCVDGYGGYMMMAKDVSVHDLMSLVHLEKLDDYFGRSNEHELDVAKNDLFRLLSNQIEELGNKEIKI